MDDLVTVLLQHGHCLCPVDGQPLLDGLLLVVKVGPLLQSGHHLLGTDGQVDDPIVQTVQNSQFYLYALSFFAGSDSGFRIQAKVPDPCGSTTLPSAYMYW